jgi:hypothetical protein
VVHGAAGVPVMRSELEGVIKSVRGAYTHELET